MLFSLTARKNSSFLHLKRDDRGMGEPRVYSITGECGKASNMQTGHPTDIWANEYDHHIRVNFQDKSTEAGTSSTLATASISKTPVFSLPATDAWTASRR
jgi:hypothetical protein